MFLIGQFDSPFVRRVGIALTLYGLPFAHKPWSVFGDFELIRPYNPLLRVPVLVLDSGEPLIESHAILDYLDNLAAPADALLPRAEPARHQALKIVALATGLAEKSISLFYEQRFHARPSELWVDRCRAQISGVLATLEADRAARGGAYWFGDRIGHADIAAAVALRFIAEALPGAVSMADYPALGALAVKLEALTVFKAICQPFTPSA